VGYFAVRSSTAGTVVAKMTDFAASNFVGSVFPPKDVVFDIACFVEAEIVHNSAKIADSTPAIDRHQELASFTDCQEVDAYFVGAD
jgi:hypothetical protein